MSEKFILAIDQGTSSSRAILFDRMGRPVAVGQQEFRQYYPQPGWVEHDPEEIWISQVEAIKTAMAMAGAARQDIVAIGITNQRETTVVWNRITGQPVHPAIVWQDRRTSGTCGRLKADGMERTVHSRTGLYLDPYFSATKIGWILDHVDGAREMAHRGELLFGTIDSWLIWKLSGGRSHVTDVTNASRTLLMNIHTMEWDSHLLDLLGIPRAILPEIRSCSELVAEVEHPHELRGLPICGVAGDQQAALFGQACFNPGMVKNTYGTGCFLLMNTGKDPVDSNNNLLTTIAWRLNGETCYALEGSVFSGGAIVQWLRDELGIIQSAQECDTLAEQVEGNGGLYLVPALAGLGAPHWDPYARGLAIGITRGTNRKHFCRAALESIAYQSAEVIECMQRDSGIHLRELRVDGGASNSRPLLQFQSDLLRKDVVRPVCTETTAQGAAFLAGLAIGFYDGLHAIQENWRISEVFNPQMEQGIVDNMKIQWDKAVLRSKSWITN